MRDEVNTDSIELFYGPSDQNAAGIFTKPINLVKSEKIKSLIMGLWNVQFYSFAKMISAITFDKMFLILIFIMCYNVQNGCNCSIYCSLFWHLL